MQTAMIERSLPMAPMMSRSKSCSAGQVVAAGRFRAGMAKLGGACTIITSSYAGERAGLTATAVCSVSAEPPRLLVCINRNVRAHQVITAGGVLGVNVLDARHETLAMRFAGMVDGVVGGDRFLEGDWADSDNGVPILRDALVSFECHVIDETVSGTHSIFLCEVTDIGTSDSAAHALVYFNRQFVPIATA
ncbi:flavin reductase family protein [Polaromonas hydrogenivorans]|uniref:Flavin reductase family protein n=1 Tax=Polaromonas hydrogenivorans TaxID=335476 RepID=A0AAU7LXU3_9BURK